MGLFDQNRSFYVTQDMLDKLVKEYSSMGFPYQQILQAWQNCKNNINNFHDELIKVSELENAKVMSLDQLNSSMMQLKSKLTSKDEDDLKRAIQLSLQNERSPETYDELKQSIRSDHTQMVGLVNLGNTCYMNVMLQALFNIAKFRNLLLGLTIPDQNTTSQDHGCLMLLRLQELFTLMQAGNRKYVSPQNFFESMAKFKPNTMLVRGVQNDYYELWVSFLDAIENGLQSVLGLKMNEKHPTLSALQTIFYGRSEELLSYQQDGNETARSSESTFGVINVDSRDAELYRAFKTCQQLNVDEFELDNKQKTKARIDVKILQPPKVLSFYINRVNYDVKTKQLKKNNQTFEFPREININLFYKDPNNMNKYNKQVQERLDYLEAQENECYEQLRHCGPDDEKLNDIFENVIKLFDESQGSLEKTLSIDEFTLLDINSSVSGDTLLSRDLVIQLKRYQTIFKRRRELLAQKLQFVQEEKKSILDKEQNMYTLTGIILHDGGAESGHYTCYILDKKRNKWFKCNDRIVTQAEWDQVLRDALGKTNPLLNASGLVYEEKTWMMADDEPSIPEKMKLFLEKQKKHFNKVLDQELINQSLGRVLVRTNQLKQTIASQIESDYTLSSFGSLETWLAHDKSLYNFHCVNEAVQVFNNNNYSLRLILIIYRINLQN